MTYDEAAERLQVDFPKMTKRELRDFTRDFVEQQLENIVGYHDYEEAFADLIRTGLLPEDKYALLHDKETEKYLEIWHLDYVVEYIEDVQEFERALQKRIQPKSGLGRVWAFIKAAFRGCRP